LALFEAAIEALVVAEVGAALALVFVLDELTAVVAMTYFLFSVEVSVQLVKT
jgi:hypothetical protein